MASDAAAFAKPPGNEPSMEEILASIRKIIADDTIGSKPDEPMLAPVAAPVSLEEVPEATPVDLSEDEDPDADVLDLAEVATIAAPVNMDFEIESVVVDLDAELQEPVSVPVSLALEPVAVIAPPVPKPIVNTAPALENHILSNETGSLIGQAFQSLQRNVTVPSTGKSLEEIVVEMLRPMLRGWLDDHLPGIVERLVKAEIERVARGG